MITLVYLSMMMAVAGAFGVMCYSRHIPKSISAMVYEYKKGFQWAWSVWIIAIGALLLVPMMEALDDRLCVFGFLTFMALCGTAVTPLVNRETSEWHDWFGVCAGVMSQCVVGIINPAWYLAWGLYVACLPFKVMRPYYVLVSEVCCSIAVFGTLIEFYKL